MKKENNERGITLIALTIAILILITLATIMSFAGKDTLESARLTKFTSELKIMQYKVNDIYSAWRDDTKITINNEEKDATTLGKELTEVQDQANKVLVDTLHKGTDGYRYFDKELLKALELENIDQEFFVNIETRSVVSKDGLKYQNKWYYTLDDLPDSLYNVGYSSIKDEVDVPTFECNYEVLGRNNYKIIISNIKYNGYIKKWYVKYQREGEDTWVSSQDLTFYVKQPGTYKIQIYNDNVVSDEEFSIKLVPIPEGYTASTNQDEDEVSEGLVIKDNDGNEYVWIEVPKEAYGKETLKIDSTKEEFTEGECDQIYNDLKAYSLTYGKPNDSYQDKIGFDNEKDYDKARRNMSKSIYQKGGFWIGRYEAGIEGSIEIDTNETGKQAKPRTSKNDTIENIKAVSQQNKYPYNYITVSQAQTLAKAMKVEGSNITSSVMFGVQWNLVCKFIEKNAKTLGGYAGEELYKALKENSRKWGNYYPSSFTIDRGKYSIDASLTWKEYTTPELGKVENVEGKYIKESGQKVLLTTGASEANRVLNIYDFAGNVAEWTLEKFNNTDYPCSYRGGSSYADGTVELARSLYGYPNNHRWL